MSYDTSDQQLNERLRDVPLPTGFVTRLQTAVADHLLEEDLRDVPVPSGFTQRLQNCFERLMLEEGDRQSGALTRRLPHSSGRRRRSISRFVTAAALTLVLSAAHLLALTGLVVLIGQNRPSEEPIVLINFGPLDLIADNSQLPSVTIESAEVGPELVVVSESVSALPIQRLADQVSIRPGPAEELLRQMRAWDPMYDVSPYLRGSLSSTADAGSPTRRAAPRHSVRWPSMIGHSRLSVLQTDEWPPLAPAPSMQSLEVPVSTATASFDEACARTAAGRWPIRERIRGEEFIAAVARPELASAENEVVGTLSLAAGPLKGQVQHYLYLAIEAGSGLPAKSAEDLRATLRFDRNVVAAYRIVGYGSPGIETLSATTLGDQLEAGQSTGVLVEVWLHSEQQGIVVEAEIDWRAAETKQQHRATASPLTTHQLSSFAEAPVAHQSAVLAAETAALLGTAPVFDWRADGTFVTSSRERTAEDLLVACRQVDPALAAQSEFQRLLTLLHQLAALRGARR